MSYIKSMNYFPNEDRIQEAARERWEGADVPEFGEHLPGCPCYDMNEVEYDDDCGASCNCESDSESEPDYDQIHELD